MKTTLAMMCLALLMVTAVRSQMCKSAADCQPDECCVVGMQRYSIPTCQRFRGPGESCRPFSEPSDRVLHYPNGIFLETQGVYTLMCPCEVGASCEAGECRAAHLDNSLD